MSQHDYDVANGSGAAVRADLNLLAASIASQNSGASAPATTFAYMLWADTTTGLLKQRNAANSAWITLWTIATGPAAQFVDIAGDTMTGDLTISKVTPSVLLNASASAQNAFLKFQTAGVDRWYIYKEATAESGSNAGSNLSINSYTDAGAYLATPLVITRSSGLIYLGNGQLGFPATQNASSGANVFDDYEEGAYTPTWTGGGTPPAIGNGTIVGAYIKIGKFVNWNFVLTMGSTTTYGTSFWLLTKPFAMNSSSAPEAYNVISQATDTSASSLYRLTSQANSNINFAPNYGSPTTLVSSGLPFIWANTDTIVSIGNFIASA